MDNKSLSNESASTKAVWEAPTIEEIDYAQTEASYIPGSGTDLGFYTT